MANLQEKLFWEPGIYQLETSDPVLAGPDGIDNLQGKQLANRTVYLKDQIEQLANGKQPAGNAAKLSAARKIEATGDGSWNVVFDGSKDVSGQLTLRDSGVTPGDYGIVTVDAKGRVTKARQLGGDDVPAHDWSKITAGKPTTLAGYGIGDGASKTDLQTAVNGLIASAPANLNTLQELAAAVNNDPKYSATVDGKLAGKADKASTLAGYGIADGVTKNQLQQVSPPGQVAYFSSPNAPDGWLRANGTQVSQTTYPNLFSAVGHAFRPAKDNVISMFRLDDQYDLYDLMVSRPTIPVSGGPGTASGYLSRGGASMSTEQAKFGTSSLKTTPNGGFAMMALAEAFSPDKFTIEGWHYPQFTGGWSDQGLLHGIFGMNASEVPGEITLAIDSVTRAPVMWLSDSNAKSASDFICYRVSGNAGVFPVSRWYHIAFSYDGATYRLFVDGKLVWVLASPRRINIPDNVLLFSVDGAGPSFNASAGGYYQDWCVSKSCNYAAEFSFPSQRVEYLTSPDNGQFYLPDLRGEFVRGWSDGHKLVDALRGFGTKQTSQNLWHDHGIPTDGGADGNDVVVVDNNGKVMDFGVRRTSNEWLADVNIKGGLLRYATYGRGGNESRPRNIALLGCIKY
ncbi:tail fiber protein [Chromobacterium vaccinii]|uniref:tail fiber protein n=1 Tax=Chromobacterium vaccinii TaxID=1108595 RepID=UPI0031D08D1C